MIKDCRSRNLESEISFRQLKQHFRNCSKQKIEKHPFRSKHTKPKQSSLTAFPRWVSFFWCSSKQGTSFLPKPAAQTSSNGLFTPPPLSLDTNICRIGGPRLPTWISKIFSKSLDPTILARLSGPPAAVRLLVEDWRKAFCSWMGYRGPPDSWTFGSLLWAVWMQVFSTKNLIALSQCLETQPIPWGQPPENKLSLTIPVPWNSPVLIEVISKSWCESRAPGTPETIIPMLAFLAKLPEGGNHPKNSHQKWVALDLETAPELSHPKQPPLTAPKQPQISWVLLFSFEVWIWISHHLLILSALKHGKGAVTQWSELR